MIYQIKMHEMHGIWINSDWGSIRSHYCDLLNKCRYLAFHITIKKTFYIISDLLWTHKIKIVVNICSCLLGYTYDNYTPQIFLVCTSNVSTYREWPTRQRKRIQWMKSILNSEEDTLLLCLCVCILQYQHTDLDTY